MYVFRLVNGYSGDEMVVILVSVMVEVMLMGMTMMMIVTVINITT